MLVDISYTIPLKELPERAKELIQRDISEDLTEQIQSRLTEACELLDEAPVNVMKVLEKVNQVRGAIAYADLRLKNVSSMISGYQEVLIEQEKPQATMKDVPHHEVEDDEKR